MDGKRFENYDGYPTGGAGPDPAAHGRGANSCNTAFIGQRGRLGAGRTWPTPPPRWGSGSTTTSASRRTSARSSRPPRRDRGGRRPDRPGHGPGLADGDGHRDRPRCSRAARCCRTWSRGSTHRPPAGRRRPGERRGGAALRSMLRAVVTEGSGRVLADLPGPDGDRQDRHGRVRATAARLLHPRLDGRRPGRPRGGGVRRAGRVRLRHRRPGARARSCGPPPADRWARATRRNKGRTPHRMGSARGPRRSSDAPSEVDDCYSTGWYRTTERGFHAVTQPTGEQWPRAVPECRMSALDILADDQRDLFIGGTVAPPRATGRASTSSTRPTARSWPRWPTAPPRTPPPRSTPPCAAQPDWAATPPRERGEILRRAFELIAARSDELAGADEPGDGQDRWPRPPARSPTARSSSAGSPRRPCASTAGGCRPRPAAAGS